MQVILLSDDVGRRINMSGAGLWGLVALVFVMVALAFQAGHRQALSERAPVRADERFEREAALLAERHRVDRALVETGVAIEQLATEVAAVGAGSALLEATGEALARAVGVRVPPPEQERIPARHGRLTERFTIAVGELEAISERLDDLGPGLKALEAHMVARRTRGNTRPAGRPVGSGWISSGFGWRTDPLNGRRAFHDGLDIAGRYRSPVIVVADGVVVEAGIRRGYGNIVEVRHRHGLATRYAHNAKNLVEVGERVDRGDVIALMGTTGRSTGAHVHFEVIENGQRVNPRPWTRSE